MLKSKKSIYLLIPLNLAIWSFFIYRFWSAYHEADVSVENNNIQISGFKTEKDSVTYTLSLSYKDPFLRESERAYAEPSSGPASRTVTKNQAPRRAEPVPAAVPKAALPDIKYLGLVKNNSSGIVTALVAINGQSRLVKANESVDGFLFKSFSKDSLVARRGSERFVVMK